MKILTKISAFCLLGISLLLISCEKVINIDLKDVDPQLVIEGAVNKDDSVHYVFITKTVNFSELNQFPSVSGAVVTLSDNAGNSEILTEVEAGKYASAHLIGVEGRTYTLTVEVEGKSYTAVSTMPNQVNLDAMLFIDSGFGEEAGMFAVPLREDPAGIKNYYRFEMAVSRFKENKGWQRDSMIMIQDDSFSDGVTTQQPLFGSIGGFLANDTCRTTMMCIDENVFKYYYSLSMNGPGGAATPANPVSNISGGALGYFSAQTKQTLETIVE